jgi:hypothetical protein
MTVRNPKNRSVGMARGQCYDFRKYFCQKMLIVSAIWTQHEPSIHSRKIFYATLFFKKIASFADVGKRSQIQF